MADRLPFAALRVVDRTRGHEQRVEVLVDGEAVCQLPATSVKYELDLHGVSQILVGVYVHDAAMTGGDDRAVGGDDVG